MQDLICRIDCFTSTCPQNGIERPKCLSTYLIPSIQGLNLPLLFDQGDPSIREWNCEVVPRVFVYAEQMGSSDPVP